MRIFQFAIAAITTAFVANQANAIAIEESEDIYETLAQSEVYADDVDVDMSFRDNLNHVSNKDKNYIKNGKDVNSGALTAKRMNREAMSKDNTNSS